MSHQSELISSDINAYLAQHERKELLRFLTCGNVDDGKSTLIGRLLHDSKMIYEDHLEAIKSDSVKSGTTGDRIDLALLVDGLQAEREQGITIDVAYRYFSTEKRKFIIADTPGHEQYTRNMATGASTCELAIILIDARHGVQTQTKRHSFITSLLGITHVVVAINKMDLVDYSEDRFNEIKAEYEAFAEQLNLRHIHFVPMSALEGDNVVNLSDKTPWYKGQPLMQILETVEIAADKDLEHFRFPVQYVNRPNLDFRGFSGTVASGRVRPGDAVTVLPSGKSSTVKSIVTYEGELDEAFIDQAVTLTLADEIDVSRGDMIVKSGDLPTSSSRFEANLVWMSEQPMQPGKQYDFKQTSHGASGTITGIKHKIDVNTLAHHPSDNLDLNEIALVEVSLNQAIAFDPYAENRATGSFIVIDRLSNVTVGAGMITAAALSDANRSDQPVSEDEFRQQYGQQSSLVLAQGSESASLLQRLQRALFDLGKTAITLPAQAGLDDSTTLVAAAAINASGVIALASLDDASAADAYNAAPAIRVSADSAADVSAAVEQALSRLRSDKLIV